MSRQAKQIDELSERKKGKVPSLFQKLLLWGVIPLMFASALFLIIAKFADINVFDKVKGLTEEIPFLEGSEKGALDFNDVVLEEQVVTLQAEIQEKEAELFQLTQQLEASADEIDGLLLEQERLLEEIESLKRADAHSRKQRKEIITTLEQMSAKSAAPVIINMNEADAIQLLTELKPDTLAAILERMPPEKAAEYMSMMSN